VAPSDHVVVRHPVTALLLGLFHERPADIPPLLLRIRDPGQRHEHAFLGVLRDSLEPGASGDVAYHIFALVRPQQTVVDGPPDNCRSIAFPSSAAAEQTPPEIARITLSLQTCSQMRRTSSTKCGMSQSDPHTQMPRANSRRISVQSGVWPASRWNCGACSSLVRNPPPHPHAPVCPRGRPPGSSGPWSHPSSRSRSLSCGSSCRPALEDLDPPGASSVSASKPPTSTQSAPAALGKPWCGDPATQGALMR